MSYRVTQEVKNLSNRCLAGFTWLSLLAAAALFLSFYETFYLSPCTY